MSSRTPSVRRRAGLPALALSLLATTAGAGDLPRSVQVFTTADRPIETRGVPPAIQVTVYDLDAPRRVEKALATGLPTGDLDAVRAEVKRRLARYTPEDIRTIWGAGYLARQAGITKTPAILFDDDTVIYGITDLSTALTLWEDHHAQTAR
ncbi:MAG TPA: DUF1525 domain-containing protein [Gammaproteobacteria bacterium]|nr:DUF1525 domain-containing protein [Gammaproteobacteria bacterium]